MTDFIDPGRVKACIRRLTQAGRDLTAAQSKVDSLERRQNFTSASSTSKGPDLGELARVRERADVARRELQQRRGEAQRFLSDIRRAVSSSRQDLGGLEQLVHGASSGRAGVESASRARRRDLDQLQALQRELEVALSSASSAGAHFGGSRDHDLYYTGTPSGPDRFESTSPSLDTLHQSLGNVGRSATSRSGRLQEEVKSSAWYMRVLDMRSYVTLPKAQAEKRLAREAEEFYHYRKNRNLTDRATDARHYVQHSVAKISRGGQGYSGRYGN